MLISKIKYMVEGFFKWFSSYSNDQTKLKYIFRQTERVKIIKNYITTVFKLVGKLKKNFHLIIFNIFY